MIVASLRTVGIEMVDFDWSAVALPAAAWMLFACSHEDGREDAVFVPARLRSGAPWGWVSRPGHVPDV
jgi:hypothetical protein